MYIQWNYNEKREGEQEKGREKIDTEDGWNRRRRKRTYSTIPNSFHQNGIECFDGYWQIEYIVPFPTVVIKFLSTSNIRFQ